MGSRSVWCLWWLAACADPAGTDPARTTPEPTTPGPTVPPEPTVPPTDPAEPPVSVEHAGTAAPPVLSVSPPPGIVDADVVVDLTVDDPTATIWYTLDDRPPVPGISPIWTGPITVDRSVVLRAAVETASGTDELTATWLRMDESLAGFSSNLPLVALWSHEDAPEWKTELYTPYTVSTFEPAPGGRTALPGSATLASRAGLKIRGSSSAWYPKHPYRLETWSTAADTDVDVELLGMAPEADWILAAPLDFDRALMRDPLMFALSNSIGRWAPRTQYVELFLADDGETVGMDDYAGVYVVTERIERDTDRVDITRLLPTDLLEPEVTGGYIFKEDRTGPGEAGFRAGTGNGTFSFQQPFVYVEPSEAEIMPEQADYLEFVLDDLGDALVSPGFVNPATGHHYSDLIDVDAWIDHHILNVLSKNPDGFRLSGYFHKDREGLIAAGPVWDFDRTMGCSSDSRAEDPEWWDASNITSDCTYVFQEGFWEGLFSDPAFRAQYFARWGQLLGNELSVATMHAQIDLLAAQVEEASVRNYAEWSSYPPRGGSHAAEVQILKDWLAARHAWISGCLALPDPMTCEGT